MLSHLEKNRQTYFQHMQTSWKYAIISLYASACFVLHGIFPAFMTTTGSNTICRLNSALKRRNSNNTLESEMRVFNRYTY